MLLKAVWLELLLLALLVWGAFVRANSYFSTPWLRWLFSLPAWFLLTGFVTAIVFVDKLPFPDLQPTRRDVDILVADQVGWATGCAVGLVVLTLALLVRGLCRRTTAVPSDVPRARSWRWMSLFGPAVLLAAAIWGETELAERSLRGRTAAIAEEARATANSLRSLPGPPVSAGENAADLYHRAGKLLPSLDSWQARWTDETIRRPGWDNQTHVPLTAEEERAAAMFVSAGRRPRCSWADLARPADEDRFAGAELTLLELLMRNRLVLSDDPSTVCETLTALRDFSSHRCRDSDLLGLFDESESAFLQATLDVVKFCPERLASLDRRELARDDAEAILGGFDADVLRIEADNARTVSKLFEPATTWDQSAFSLNVRVKEYRFEEQAGGLRRLALRVRRVSDGDRVLDVYRLRMDQFRQCVASAKAGGHPVWQEWRDLKGKPIKEVTWDEAGRSALQEMLTQAYRRHALLSKRRLANSILAVAIFRHERGRLPASLEELVPAYLPAVPIDAVTGEPLGFATDADHVYVFASDRPHAESGGLSEPPQPWEPRKVVSFAVRVSAPLQAGKPSAKLPNPQP
jgi:hypothetical protein